MDKNVTVLKHGSSHTTDNIVFHCYSCGCEFSVPRTCADTNLYAR